MNQNPLRNYAGIESLGLSVEDLAMGNINRDSFLKSIRYKKEEIAKRFHPDVGGNARTFDFYFHPLIELEAIVNKSSPEQLRRWAQEIGVQSQYITGKIYANGKQVDPKLVKIRPYSFEQI